MTPAPAPTHATAGPAPGAVPSPDENLFAWFARQADATPDAVAIVSGDGDFTSYRELLARAERIARRLHARGMAPEEPVGILMRRTPDLVASLLAILRVGGACVPFDLENPPDRQRRILKIGGCRLIVGDPGIAAPLLVDGGASAPEFLDLGRLDDAPDATVLPPVAPGGDRMAYILFTSGSTGEPKGVEIEHRNIFNMLVATIGLLRVTAADRMLAVSTIGFDQALAELYVPLVTGGSLLLRGRELWMAPRRLAADLLKFGVTIVATGPSTWAPTLAELAGFPRVRVAITTAEPVSPALARKLAGIAEEAWNLYGPTEATVWITGHRIAPDPIGASPDAAFSEPIGTALDHTLLVVRGEDGRVLGVGERGELWIGGASLSRGYRDDPAMTAARFQPVGPRGERCYRTGDLAEWRADGSLLYHGRNDEQIKVRGNRIEPQEVEAAILRDPRVAMAAATWFAASADSRAIVAAIVVRPGQTLSARDLYKSLPGILPASMIPSRFVFLETLPRLPNGKVDRKTIRLAAAEPIADAAPGPGTRALSPTESVVHDVWCRVLGIRSVRPDDHFFGLGGDSFAAVKVGLELESRLRVEVPVRLLFETPTLEGLAARIDRERHRSATDTSGFVIALSGNVDGPPLFFNEADLGVARDGAWSVPCRLHAVSHFAQGNGYFAAESVAELAAIHLAAIRRIQPRGPYRLAGYSFGGLVTLEIARRLAAEGQSVEFVFLLDPTRPTGVAGTSAATSPGPCPRDRAGWWTRAARWVGYSIIRFNARWPNRIAARLVPADPSPAFPLHAEALAKRHVVRPYKGRVTAVFSGRPGSAAAWQALLGHDTRILYTDVRHAELFSADAKRFWMPPLAELMGVVPEAEMIAPAPAPVSPGIRSDPPSPADSPGAPVPLSPAQERLWILDQLDPDGPGYTVALCLRLRGDLDAPALERALREIVRRHQVLRTTVGSVDGVPHPVVAPEADARLETIDLRAHAPGARETEAWRLARGEEAWKFDLSRGPMMRARLLRLADDDHQLLLAFPHIAFDGTSEGILWRELDPLYRSFAAGLSSPLPGLPLQYAEHAARQRDQLRGELLERLVASWKSRLAGAPPVLALPTDRPRPATPSIRGAVLEVAIDPGLTRELRGLARREGSTLFMAVLAAWKVMLARLSGQDDLVVGVPTAGRNHADLDQLIGFFINTLPMRTDLSGNPTFREALNRVRESTTAAFADQELPFEKLVEELQPERDAAHTPVFQVAFNFQKSRPASPALGDLGVQTIAIPSSTAKFDLTLNLRDDEAEGLRGNCVYRSDLFEAATIGRWFGHFETLLRAVVADPDRGIGGIRLAGEAERRQVLLAGNPATTPYPDGLCVHQLFEAQARRTPSAIAVVHDGEAVTYGELDRRSNQLARALRAHGVVRGDRIALHLERSPGQLVAILAVLKCGACYVPLPPEYPAARRQFMLSDSGATLALSEAALPDAVGPSACRVLDPGRIAAADVASAGDLYPATDAGPGDLAYIIYTSGSTGKPKGVMVEHRSIARLVFGQDYATFGPDRVFLQLAPVAFDASTFEIWGALLHGSKLVVVPEGPLDLAAIGTLIRTHGVTTLWLTAALFDEVVASRPDILAGVGEILAGGEALSPRHVRLAHERLGPGTRIINGYGPTECTTFACCHPIPHDFAGGNVPIGRPIANTRAYVLDETGDLVPIGVSGELYLAGPGLARGYLNQPKWTAERFVPDPFADAPGERMYRTGDRVRWTANGTLEFLGRRDQQVKIRGFRIELGEIERALGEHPGVGEAIVESRARPDGARTLVAFWTTRDGNPAAGDALARYLGTRLPAFMVPTAWVPVDAWPLTPAGKIDRRALPDPWSVAASARESTRPNSVYEVVLREIFAGVLARKTIGLDDNFFGCGGHSLMALRLIDRVDRHFGLRLPVRVLFEDCTVRTLARRVEATRRGHPEGLSFPGTDPLVTLREGDAAKTLFVFPGGYGDESEFLTHAWIAHRHLGPGPAVRAFRNRAWRGAGPLRGDLRGIARDCIADMRRAQPRGPWHLVGLCVGGNLAFEVALQLQEAGDEVAMLAIADTPVPGRTAYRERCLRMPGMGGRHWLANTAFLSLPWLRSWMTSGGRRVSSRRLLEKLGRRPPEPGSPEAARLAEDRHLSEEWRHYQTGEGYLRRLMVPPRGHFRGRLDLALSAEMSGLGLDADWAPYATGGTEVLVLPGPHATYQIEGADRLADLYARRMAPTETMRPV